MSEPIVTNSQSKGLHFQLTNNSFNWLLLTVVLVALMTSLFFGYQALQSKPISAPVVVATPAPVKLKLHTTHLRYGAPIEAPTQVGGRTSPF